MPPRRHNAVSRMICFVMSMTLCVIQVIPTQAQSVSSSPTTGVFNLPAPGVMVVSSQAYSPVVVQGINLYPDDPFKFDFIFDKGTANLGKEAFQEESQKLVEYFLASLTVPEKQMWVNLSPYEKDRIIPETFGKTGMGRDLLAQDYLLKQLSSSLMHPDEGIGREFWQRVYKQAQDQFETTEIPMNTFNKIWIVPDTASIYEHERGAFIVKTYLKVMLEEDYLALEANQNSSEHGLGDVAAEDLDVISGVVSDVVRKVLIPEIEREVNEGKTFANLRQIYNSMLLASWYKKVLKESILTKLYADQGKTEGLEVADKEINQKIYQQYVKAFETGVYDFIRDDYDPATQTIIPRKYFSGGAKLDSKYMRSEAENLPDVAEKITAEVQTVKLVDSRENPDDDDVVGMSDMGAKTKPVEKYQSERSKSSSPHALNVRWSNIREDYRTRILAVKSEEELKIVTLDLWKAYNPKKYADEEAEAANKAIQGLAYIVETKWKEIHGEEALAADYSWMKDMFGMQSEEFRDFLRGRAEARLAAGVVDDWDKEIRMELTLLNAPTEAIRLIKSSKYEDLAKYLMYLDIHLNLHLSGKDLSDYDDVYSIIVQALIDVDEKLIANLLPAEVQALSDIGTSKAAITLIEALKHPKNIVRFHAMRGLSEIPSINTAKQDHQTQIYWALASIVDPDDPDLMAAALELLERLSEQYPQEVAKAIGILLTNIDSNDKFERAPIETLLYFNEDFTYRGEEIFINAGIHVVPEIIKTLKIKNDQITLKLLDAKALMEILGYILKKVDESPEEYFPIFINALKHPNGEIRSMAASVLHEVHGWEPQDAQTTANYLVAIPDIDELERRLEEIRDRDLDVRNEHAFKALEAVLSNYIVEDVEYFYAGSDDGEDPFWDEDAKYQALALYRQLLPKVRKEEGGNIITNIEAALLDNNPANRMAAYKVLERIDWETNDSQILANYLVAGEEYQKLEERINNGQVSIEEAFNALGRAIRSFEEAEENGEYVENLVERKNAALSFQVRLQGIGGGGPSAIGADLRKKGIQPAGEAISSMVNDDKTKGGIDLNPAITTMDVQRSDAGVIIPQLPVGTVIKPGPFNGLVPRFLNSVPIPNVLPLLGLGDRKDGPNQASSSNDENEMLGLSERRFALSGKWD